MGMHLERGCLERREAGALQSPAGVKKLRVSQGLWLAWAGVGGAWKMPQENPGLTCLARKLRLPAQGSSELWKL